MTQPCQQLIGFSWLNDGSCVRQRPEYPDHHWSYHFVHLRTDNGKAFRTQNTLEEHSRGCLAIRVQRKLTSSEVIDVRSYLFILRSAPQRAHACPRLQAVLLESV